MSVETIVDFTSVRNRNEQAVFAAVARHAGRFPEIGRA